MALIFFSKYIDGHQFILNRDVDNQLMSFEEFIRIFFEDETRKVLLIDENGEILDVLIPGVFDLNSSNFKNSICRFFAYTKTSVIVQIVDKEV